jgi:hypothetical protein
MTCDLKWHRGLLSKWLQYLYFLRFPLLGWIMLPVLCLMDGCTGASAVTRGIMTLSRGWQAFYTAFFVTALMMAVLICARNIVRNGRIRFRSAPPPSLRRVLTTAKQRRVWIVLAVAHIPTALTLFYVAWTTIQEKEAVFGTGYWRLWGCYALGLLLAFVFWYLVSIFYLWTYPAARNKEPSALLFPGTMRGFKAAQNTSQPWVAVWIEAAARKVLWITHSGYASTEDGPLWELHSLTTVALSAYFLLYLFLYPLIAPVVVSKGILDAVSAVVIVILLVLGARKTDGGMDRVGLLFSTIEVVMLAIFLGFLYYDGAHRSVMMETAFPTLASVLVILIFFLWLLSGASFLLDRYRIPVLVTAVLVVFIPKYLSVDQEHYFEATDTTRIDAIDSPNQAIEHRIKDPDEPIIIVTASGGGIQAAEWTAQVMAQLEKRFREDQELNGSGKPGFLFHDHLLLASGVSGGSVGLMPYLLEYTADPSSTAFLNTKDGALTQRLTRAPGCSSLEAVAWGMEYYDLQRLLATFRFSWLQATDKGDAPDRTWALSEALNRNLNDKDCKTTEFMGLPDVMSGEELTLKRAALRLQAGTIPAFTFNTTVAETGGRFLLSNYAVPAMATRAETGPLQPGSDFLPSESFLQAYTQESHCDLGNLKSDCYADVSLATAARLSATFPVVSSGTRIPKRYATVASHFLDGGYFDNDGTASVIEFLYSAMDERKRASSTPQKLKVLLVEIRDGEDLNPIENMDDWKHQNGLDLEIGAKQPNPWTTGSQIGAPLLGMWNAGHVSVTRRNRRELCSLEKAFAIDDLIEIHHVVMGITSEPMTGKPGQYKSAPLSWKLTASQKQYIQDWAEQRDKPTQQTIDEAIRWVKKNMPEKNKLTALSPLKVDHNHKNSPPAR